MLFTPSLPRSSASASVKSESSPVHTSAVRKGRHVDKQPPDVNSSSSNAHCGSYGPSSSQSHVCPTADRDWFYSPLSCSSSSSHPSIPLTTPTATAELHSLNSHRADSCPLVQPKVARLTSSIWNVLMAATTSTSPSIHHSPKAIVHLRPTAMVVSVANPLAVADDDDEPDQPIKSMSPSPMVSTRFDHSPTDGSTTLCQPPSNVHRKVILNVGGVRHEGTSNAASVYLCIPYASSAVANALSAAKHAARSSS